jgi:hypothetical protein
MHKHDSIVKIFFAVSVTMTTKEPRKMWYGDTRTQTCVHAHNVGE